MEVFPFIFAAKSVNSNKLVTVESWFKLMLLPHNNMQKQTEGSHLLAIASSFVMQFEIRKSLIAVASASLNSTIANFLILDHVSGRCWTWQFKVFIES